jgi:AcrR family transcriptional regulator
MSTKVKRRPAQGGTGRRGAARGRGAALPGPPEAHPADPRHAALRRAAFEAIVECGVSASTEEIARRARVSKREIYRLFGSKEVLLTDLVRQRAAVMRRALDLPPPPDRAAALETLERFGREFLALLTAPATIALYRLVIGEAGRRPELGRELDAHGRGTVWPALKNWMAEAARRGALPVTDVDRAAGTFMVLLMGDLPTRLMLGAVPTPPEGELLQRAVAAAEGFARLWLPSAGAAR